MSKKQKVIGMMLSVIILLILISISYALLKTRILGNSGNLVYEMGDLDVILEEDSIPSLELIGKVPVLDKEGMESEEVYRFTVRNKGKGNVRYQIYLDDDSEAFKECGDTCNLLENKDVKYELKKEQDSSINTLENRMLKEASLKANSSDTYELRLWLSSEAENDAMNKYFFGKIRIEIVQEENIPNQPILSSNMIPVRYDGENWVKASKGYWYDYNQQEWANAVTVSEGKRKGYLEAADNTPILMEDINTMWVWIPRYSYTIGSEDGTNYYGKKGKYLDTTPTQALPGEIDVEFVDKNTKDRGSAKYKVSEGVSGWYTPDAFTFGGKELTGVWVGKFETSSSNPEAANGGGDVTNLNAVIKPKVTSWRKIKVSTLETVAMKMNKESNIYGFVEEEVDTHAMKGSEWALAAYLSQSKYGKLGNRNYTGENKQVYMNAYTGFRTGCSYGSPSYPTDTGESQCSYEYDDLEDRGEGKGAGGAGASTTGTIYGIYDMNGGTWDYVMSNFNDYTGNTQDLNSGYTGMLTDGSQIEGIPYPDEKYYDKYLSISTNLVSHALGETAGWYGDYYAMVNSTLPWQSRGGDWSRSSYAGVFSFHNMGYAGGNHNHMSFRLVLVNE